MPLRDTRVFWGLPALLLILMGFTLAGDSSALLSDQIDQILYEQRAEAAFWGIYVQDLSSGRVVAERNADKSFLPASNQKLLTAAAALDALGTTFRYETRLHLDGTIEDGILTGDLIIEGAGDPSFGSRNYATDPLHTWALGLKAQGVHTVRGRLIGDDDVFGDAAYASGWDLQHIATAAFAPASSGLSYRDNLVHVEVTAGSPGRSPQTVAEPAGYLDVRNRATTTSRRRGRALRVDRPVGQELVHLEGRVGRSYRRTLRLPVANPTAFAVFAFAEHLKAVGIAVEAEQVDVDALGAPAAYDGTTVLFTHQSPPLADLLAEINKASNNLYAEQLFRTFGWGGTTRGGATRVLEFIRAQAIDAGGLSVRDGSGLSRKDLASPRTLAGVLQAMHSHPERDVYLASLAQGGEPGTTLAHRLADLPVQAKTGSLEHVRALSGYTTTRDGRTLNFVLLANHYTVPSYRVVQAMDAIVELISTRTSG
ncbi:MAG: D-alanyl-D-alanine carboxypeptidase/D-alanyl-D-alanine-endopeptidase [Bacteroidota bacterium]